MGAAPDHWTRRQFLRTTLAASAGLFLSGQTGFGRRSRAGSRPRGLIIGAGFSGLACAFELLGVGAEVIVLEARSRQSGRVLCLDSCSRGKVVEAGAELVDSNHPTWAAYADRFGLHFGDVVGAEPGRSPIILNGRVYQGQVLVELWNSMFMNWPADKYTLCGYRSPALGRGDGKTPTAAGRVSRSHVFTWRILQPPLPRLHGRRSSFRSHTCQTVGSQSEPGLTNERILNRNPRLLTGLCYAAMMSLAIGLNLLPVF